ncbi:MAG: acyl-CoA dehydrogenase family protein, partial [Pseudomonadales bacterium]|nr:acyl-CoA dehydrogenase family protein [Pseudomonadales bacterium]
KTWVREESPVLKLREMRDADGPNGFDTATWRAIAELGWCGILIPEEYGGSGMDLATFGVVLEETGRGLVASPLFASCLVGASALLLGGTEDQKRTWLPRIASGEAIVTLAVDEGPHHAPEQTRLAAKRAGGGYTLSGEKVFVMEGNAADAFVVAARTGGKPGETKGISLFVVPGDAKGITRRRIKLADSRGYADVSFDNVEVGGDALLGSEGEGFAVLDATLDRARAGLAAEMLGTGAEAFDRTLEYLKTRVQFGQVIGSFQSLGHRAATHFMNMELARSCVEAALAGIDDGADDAAVLTSLAKCQIGDFLHDMTNDMIQMHGGIGMTDEFDAGFFLKRARVTETAFGNQSYHRRRYISAFGI